MQQFLRDIFKLSDASVFASPAHMRWKFWEPRPGWEGSRSYAYRDESGTVVAHAGVWPFDLLTSEGKLVGIHPIDWAASRKARGAGVSLLRDTGALGDFCCAMGGTAIAQIVILQAGFKAKGTMRLLARPLRPFRQVRTHQRRDWKLPVRYVRNAVWAMGGGPAPAGWTAEPVPPRDLPEAVLPLPEPGLAVAARPPELLEYLLRCPIARYQAWLVRQNGEPRGYFLLCFVPGQARIADAWVHPRDAGSWRALYALAVRAALEEGSTAEVVTAATLAAAFEGALACGFRSYGDVDVMLHDPTGRVERAEQIHLQMIENDMSFLNEGRIEYVT